MLIAKLTAFFRIELIPYDTLIFFDEVQECLEVRTAIKFLVDDGRFDYIESGSLLGITYENITSYPVGYEDPQTMYPMDLEEFAIALGVQQTTFDLLKQSYLNHVKVDDFIHKEMLKVFRFYCVVGGMPAVVQEFIDSSDMGKVLNTQRSIIELYRKDVQKYAEKGKEKIQMIFDAIPAELNNKNKRFVLSDLKKSARSELIMNENLDINEGSIMENMFATQLKCNGFALYYYDKKRVGELDFVVEYGSELLPIEIKSGKSYQKHAALHHVTENRNLKVKKPIVFCIGNVEETEEVFYLPLYMIMYLKDDHHLGIVQIDLKI